MGADVTFAERIKELRLKNNMTIRMMAEEIGISPMSVSYYENCKREATISVAKAYAKYFNVSLDYLLGLEDKNG